MIDLILSLLIFTTIIVALSVLRLKIGAKFEIKNSDILIALIPVALWLILTGKVQVFEFGGFKIESAFIDASQNVITKQIDNVKLPVDEITHGRKGTVAEIPGLIKKEIEALTFELGDGEYDGHAIAEYLSKLSDHSFFKYVIFSKNGGFVGIANARKLNFLFITKGEAYGSDFAQWVNESKVDMLSRLPGFVSIKDAIKNDDDKQKALEKMEALNIDTLPVINEMNEFKGLVDRSRLTASLIIDVSRKLLNKK